jgi:hypothetical protein
MTMRIRILEIPLLALVLNGCSHYSVIRFEEAERTNYVQAHLATGKTIRGSVVKADPFLLSILQKDSQIVPVQRDAVLVLLRKPTVADEFGKGISEEEIAQAQKKKNTFVYGLGGGALSFGFSFFAGSLLGHASRNGTALMAGTALTGTLAGTLLFLHAGKAQDRKEAIASIRADRRKAGARPDAEKTPQEQIQRLLESEREKQEKARLQREELLRELEQSKNEKKTGSN